MFGIIFNGTRTHSKQIKACMSCRCKLSSAWLDNLHLHLWTFYFREEQACPCTLSAAIANWNAYKDDLSYDSTLHCLLQCYINLQGLSQTCTGSCHRRDLQCCCDYRGSGSAPTPIALRSSPSFPCLLWGWTWWGHISAVKLLQCTFQAFGDIAASFVLLKNIVPKPQA